jgi:hypothetical protein
MAWAVLFNVVDVARPVGRGNTSHALPLEALDGGRRALSFGRVVEPPMARRRTGRSDHGPPLHRRLERVRWGHGRTMDLYSCVAPRLIRRLPAP